MKASEKRAKEALKARGHFVTKNGDGRHPDDLDAETYKQGPLSRLFGTAPKKVK